MKIIHLSSSTSGGAGIAAKNLANLQNSNHDQSFVISRDISSTDLEISIEGSLAQRILSKANTILSTAVAQEEYSQLTPYSVNFPVKEAINMINPDVIHVHNWFNLISIGQLVELNSRVPVVFTLHDFRLFTGGCHFTLGCKNYLDNCENCPATKTIMSPLIGRSRNKMTSSLNKMKNYGIVSPSRWLLSDAEKTEIFLGAKAYRHIPNKVVASNDIKDISTENPRSIYFIAAQPLLEVKGLKYLLEAFNGEYLRSHNLIFKIIGPLSDTLMESVEENNRVILLGSRMNSEIFNGVNRGDILAIPSLSENSPNIVTEAQLAGMLVMGSNISGISEMIDDEISGFIFELNTTSIQETVWRAMSSEVESILVRARNVANQRNDSKLILDAHHELYSELV